MSWLRGKPKGVVHHNDRGSQYLSIRYTERLANAGFNASVGSVGDSYDNALAETINGLYKAEVIHKDGPWRGLDDVERATLTWVDWFRLLRPIAEYEFTCIINKLGQAKPHDSDKAASDLIGTIHCLVQSLIATP